MERFYPRDSPGTNRAAVPKVGTARGRFDVVEATVTFPQGARRTRRARCAYHWLVSTPDTEFGLRHAHPIVAAIYDRLSESQERAFLGRLRETIVGASHGAVVEIGAGTGRNFLHYRRTLVHGVIAFEPDRHMRRRAEARLEMAGVEIRLSDGVAESLPIDDHCADTVVATLVLCSVDDPKRAVQEIRRILRPSGTFAFIEHVRSDDARRMRLQDWVTPCWRHLAANCHPNRPTLRTLRECGFEVREEQRLAVGASWVQPLVAGFATLG